MIRPRGGDSVYSIRELEVMEKDIAAARQLGANGVVLGVLRDDGRVDIRRTEQLVKLASPMQVTFHRAFDMTPDLEQACEDVIAAGAHRILTSGGKQTARKGGAQIARLVKRAGTRVGVMAGSGINARNAVELARVTGAVEFHASLRKQVKNPVKYRKNDVSVGVRKSVDFIRFMLAEADVRALRQALDSAVATAIAGHAVE